MRQLLMDDIQQSLRSISWRRLFEQPIQLERWVYFHLSAVHGKRTKEMALLSHHVAQTLTPIYRSNGPLYLARYLKVCMAVTKASLGGRANRRPFNHHYYEPDSSSVMVSLSRYGLPRIILLRHRVLMMRGIETAKWVRTYLTVFSLMKLIIVKSQVDLSDIDKMTDLGPCYMPKLGPIVDPQIWIHRLDPALLKVPLVTGLSNRLLWTSGPRTGTNLVASAFIQDDAAALLEAYISLDFRFSEVLWRSDVRFLRGWYKSGDPIKPSVMAFRDWLIAIQGDRGYAGPIGRLCSVDQPAGKTRLFAILDSLSQRILQSFHDWASTLLKAIPQDGTFAQMRPVDRLIRMKRMNAFSYDLKSATDRMPAEVSERILSKLWGSVFATAWRSLCYRKLKVSPSVPTTYPEKEVIFVQGTPLGAISAWPIFAFTHHLLVQQAAYNVTKTKAWFADYAILGDDLVIVNSAVAKQYKRIIRKLEVKISMSKSMRSFCGSFEFASRYILKGVDLSPISFKLLSSALQVSACLPSFLKRVGEFRTVSMVEVFRLRGAGYRRLPLANVPFSSLYKLPRKWVRTWLIVNHPWVNESVSWPLWLSAGRKSIVPWEAIGVLNEELRKSWEERFQFIIDESLIESASSFQEDLLFRPWLELQLNLKRDVLIRMINGELLDPYLDYTSSPSTLLRRPLTKGSSASAHKWVKVLKVYERMSRILSAPLPRLLN